MTAQAGYCSVCGAWLRRRGLDGPVLDPGTLRRHTHPVPWRLLAEPPDPAPELPQSNA